MNDTTSKVGAAVRKALPIVANEAERVFHFNTAVVRTSLVDGAIWFSAADVCAVLGIKNHRDSLAHLDADERGVVSTDTPHSNQHGAIAGQFEKISVVSESGLYSLVLRSRKPEARNFAKWVTSEVLPQIRKTGAYGEPVISVQERYEHLARCAELAHEAAGQFQKATYEALSQYYPDRLKDSRFLVTVLPDGKVYAKIIDREAAVMTPTQFIKALNEPNGMFLETEVIADCLHACTTRLAHRAEYLAKKAAEKVS